MKTRPFMSLALPLASFGKTVAVLLASALVLELAAADADNDGLDDAQETAVHNTSPARWDTDGDGQGDGAEVRSGTNPLSAQSSFRILTNPLRTPSGWEVSWTSVSGRKYRLQRADGDQVPPLNRTWVVIAEKSATSGVTSAIDTTPTTAGKRFYRVVLVEEGTTDDTIPPVISPIQVSNIQSESGGKVRFSVTATDNVGVDSVAFYNAQTQLGLGIPGLNDIWTYDWTPPTGIEGTQTIQAAAADAAGNRASSSALEITFASKDLFTPLGPDGKPVDGYAIQVGETGTILPVEYHPGGPSALGGRRSFFLRFPRGAKVVEINGVKQIEFTEAIAGFGEGFPLQLAEELKVTGTNTRRIPLGPVSFQQLADLFGAPVQDGVSVRMFGKLPLLWKGGTLQDGGMTGAQFALAGTTGPLQGTGSSLPDVFIDFNSKDGIAIPLFGEFTLPDGSDNSPRLIVPREKPIWLGIRQDGSMYMRGGAELAFPNGGSFKVGVDLDDPNYQLKIIADGLQFKTLGNLADLLPGSAATCVPGSATPTAEELRIALQCLQRFELAYFNFNTALMGESAQGELDPSTALATPAAALSAWSFRNLASPLLLDAQKLRDLDDLFLQTGESATTTPDLSAVLAHRLALIQAKLSQGANVSANLTKAIADAQSAMLDRIRNGESVPSLESLRETVAILLETERLIQANGDTRLANTSVEIAAAVTELYNSFLKRYLADLGITPRQAALSGIPGMNRFVAYETLRDLIEVMRDAQLLGLQLQTGVPLPDALIQLGLHLESLLAAELGVAKIAADYRAYLYAMEDYLELHAWQSSGAIPTSELDAKLAARPPQFLAGELGAVANADVTFGTPAVSLRNQAAEVKRLAKILRQVPPTVTFPADSLKRAFDRMEASIQTAITTLSLYDLQMLADLLEAGTLHEEIREKFNFPTTEWESGRLVQVVDRLRAKGIEEKGWALMHKSAAFLLKKAERLVGIDNAEAKLYVEQALKLIVGEQLIASALWQQESASRAGLSIVDMLLPGEIQVNKVAGSLSYNRDTRLLKGAFRGELRMPKFDLSLNIANASFSSGGAFDINLTGGVDLPFQSPPLKFQIPKRHPLTIRYRAPRELAISAGGKLILPDGSSVMSYFTIADPLYRFGIEARGLHLNLASNLTVNLPTLPAAGNFAPELLATLNEYYRGLAASMESLSGLEEIPQLGDVGAVPEFQERTLSVSPDLLNSFAASVLADVQTGVNRSYSSMTNELRQKLGQLADELREQRDNVHISEILIRGKALQRMCQALKLKREQGGAMDAQAIWDAPETRRFVEESEASVRHLLTREDTRALDNIESAMEAVMTFMAAAECMGYDMTDLIPLIQDFHNRAWVVAYAALYLDPNTGLVTNQTEFDKIPAAKLLKAFQTLSKFNQRTQVLGWEPNAVERTAIQTLAMRYRELLLGELRVLSIEDPINYYEIGRLTRALLAFHQMAQSGAFDYPSTPIVQLDGSRRVIDSSLDLTLNFLANYIGMQGSLAAKVEQIGHRALVGLRRDKGKDYFGNTLPEVIRLKEAANVQPPPSLTAELNRIFAIQLEQVEAALQSRWTAERLHDAKEILDELVGLAIYAQAMNLPEAPRIGTLISDTLTPKMTVSAEAQKSAWLLNRYINLLLEAAQTKVGNDQLVIKNALESAATSSIRAADRIVRAFKNLLPTISPVDIALPGAVRINRAFGEVTYRRDTGVLGGRFGGRLEFPNHNAWFDVSEGSIDTTGAFRFKASTSGPLPIGGVRLTAALDAEGGPNRPFAITGTGEILLGSGEKFSAMAAYSGADSSLQFRAAGENLHLLITPHACLFGANLGFKLGGIGQNGQLLQNGELSFGGTVGLLRTDAPPKSATAPSPEDFHVVVENALAQFQFEQEQFRFVLAQGSLLLPGHFSTALCTEVPVGGERPRARVSIQADRPITAAFKYNPLTLNQAPEITSVKLSGAINLQNIGVSVPNFDDVAAAICEGSIVFPTVELTRTSASITALPLVQIQQGKFHMPLPPSDPTELELRDFVWDFKGFPVGTLALAEDVTFFDQGGFSFTVLGGNSCGPDRLASGLRVLPPQQAGQLPVLEIHGGVRLRVAKSVMRKEAGTGDPTLPGQDPEEIQGEACGNVLVRPNSSPEFTWERASIAGTFRLGENGIKVEGARLDLVNLHHIFDQAVNPQEPFTIGLSGKITVPNGPGFGVQNAKFVFNNLNPNFPGLPQFQPGSFTYDATGWQIGQYLPFEVKEATITFKDGTKQYPAILQPTNVKVTVSAGLALPPGDTPIFKGEVGDFEVNFLQDGTPVFSMDSVAIELNTGSNFPPMEDLGGKLYVGGLSDPRNLFITGKVGGSYQGYRLKLLVAFNLGGPVGMCLDVNAGNVGIPLVYGFLITGASGGVSFLNRMNDPCDFASYIDPVTGKPVSSSTQLPPGLPPFPVSLMSWTEFRGAMARFQQAAEAYAPKPGRQSADSPEAIGGFFPAAADAGGFEIDCPGDCPPATVNIFCQPHPDQERYPGRIITKFTSIDEDTLNNVFGVTKERIQQWKNSGVNMAQTVAGQIRTTLETTIPKPSPTLLGAEQAAKIQALYDQTMTLIENGFKEAFAAALANQSAADLIYNLVRDIAYVGLPCVDMTFQVSGTGSHLAVSSFLSVTGQGTLSTTGAAGVSGRINLLGMPVGKGKVFINATDEKGELNPSACGEVVVELGPLRLGELKAALQCEGCVSGILSVFGELAASLSQQTLQNLLARVVPRLQGVSVDQLVLQMSDVEKVAFIAELMQMPAQSLPQDLPQRLVTALGDAWNQLNPEFLMCGKVGVKLFGIPLGADIVDVKGRVHKTGRQAEFSFSPSSLVGYALLGNAGMFLSVDTASFGYQETYPDPMKLLLAGLTGTLSSPQAMANFAQEQFASMLENTTGVMSYELSPLGMRLASAQGRIVLPDLTNHPEFRSAGWLRPEQRGLPSRLDILQVALRSQLLGNALWSGSTQDFTQIFPQGSAERTQYAGLSLTKDFFPHGGVIGAGFIDVPKVLYDAPPQEYFTMLDPTKNTLERLGAASSWIFNYVLTTTNAGQLGFYVPAPNPPSIKHADGTPYTPRETLDAIMNFDITNPQPGELWSLSEAFLKGHLRGMLLGVPIGNAEVLGVAPGNGGDAYLEVRANMPTNSWLSNFVQSASLLFDLRQSPTNTIEAAFTALRGEVEALRAKDPAQRTEQEMTAMMKRVMDEIFKALPKARLEAQLLNFRFPPSLQQFVETPTGANNYFIYGYSPRFEPAFVGEGPVAERRRNGGLAFKGSFLFGKYFRVDDAELGIVPKPPEPLTGFYPPPALSGRFRNINATLPGDVQFNNVQLEFNSEPLPGQALIDVTGEFPEINLLPYLEVDAINRAGTLRARMLIKRGLNNLPESEIKVDPARVYMPYFDPTKAITIDGGTATTPFTFSTDPNTEWSGRVTFQDYVSFKVGTSELFRYEGPGISGTLKAKGLSNGSITVALNNAATLIAYPNTTRELRFQLNPLDASASFTIRADGTFEIIGKLQADLALPFGPVDRINAGASVHFTQDQLVIGGTIIGGVLDEAAVASASGQMVLNNTGTISFTGEISVPNINLGIFHLVNPQGPNLVAQLTNDGLRFSAAELRVDGLGSDSSTAQIFQCDLFNINNDGSFDINVRASTGQMNISGFPLATTSLRLKRTGATSVPSYVTTLEATLQLQDPQLPFLALSGSVKSSGQATLSGELGSAFIKSYSVGPVKMNLVKESGLAAAINVEATLSGGPFSGLKVAGAASRGAAGTTFSLDFTGDMQLNDYILRAGQLHLYRNADGTSGLAAAGGVDLPGAGRLNFSGGVNTVGRYSLSNSVSNLQINSFTISSMTNVLSNTSVDHYNAVVQSSPIGYWRFNDGSGTIARTSVAGIDGVYVEAPNLANPGVVVGNRSVTLNGYSQYVRLGNDARYNLQGAFSLECWVKINAFTRNWEAIMTKGDNAWRLHRNGSARTVAFGANGLGADLAGTSIIDDGQWHHLAAVYDGAARYLYVDGSLEAYAPSTGNVAINAYNVLIGENEQAFNRFFNGSIDEAAIYNRALSPDEVQSHFAGGYSGARFSTTLVLNYPGLTSLRFSGTVNEGGAISAQVGPSPITLNGYQLSQGIFRYNSLSNGNSMIFVNGSVSTAGLNASVTGSFRSDRSIDLSGTLQNANLETINIQNLNVRLAGNLNTLVTLTTSGKVNVPNLALLDFNGSISTAGAVTMTNIVSINSSFFNYTAARYTNVLRLDGTSDYFSAVNADSPIGWWRLEESSSTFADSNPTATKRSGTLVGGATRVEGALLRQASLNYARKFDGTSGYISIANSSPLNFSGSFTVEFWAKIPSFSKSWEAIVAKGDNSWRISRYSGTTKVSFETTSASGNHSLPSQLDCNDNQWHHYVAVFDGYAKYLYIDGALENWAPYTGPVSSNSNTVYLGENQGATGRYFGGALDEVALYDKALLPPQIQKHYRASGRANIEADIQLTLPALGGVTLNGVLSTRGSAGFFGSGNLRLGGYDLFNSYVRFAKPVVGDAFILLHGNISVPGLSLTRINGSILADGTMDLTSSLQGISMRGFQFNDATLRLTGNSSGVGSLFSSGRLVTDWFFMDFNGSVSTGGLLNMTNITAARDMFGFGVNSITNIINHADYRTTVRNDAPTAYWRLADPDLKSTVAFQEMASSVSLHGTYTGGVTRGQPGALTFSSNESVRFNGTDAYIAIPSETTFDYRSALSVEAWVKISSFNRDWQTIVAKGDSSWRLSRYGSTSKISFDTTKDGQNHSLVSQRNFNPNEWYHLVAVFDGQTKYLYVNGILESLAPYEGQIDANSYTVAIGENFQARNRYWNGWIDEVALYGKALTAGQVARHYQAAGGRILVTSLYQDFAGFANVGFSGAVTPEAAFSLQAKSTSQSLTGISFTDNTLDFAKPASGNPVLNVVANASVPTGVSTSTPVKMRGTLGSDRHLVVSATLPQVSIRDFNFNNPTFTVDAYLGTTASFGASAKLKIGTLPEIPMSGTISVGRVVDLDGSMNLTMGGFGSSSSVKFELNGSSMRAYGSFNLQAGTTVFHSNMYFDGAVYTSGNYSLTGTGRLRIGGYDAISASYTLNQNGVRGFPSLTYGDADSHVEVPVSWLNLTSSGIDFYAQKTLDTGWKEFGTATEVYGRVYSTLKIEDSNSSGSYNAYITGGAYGWRGWPPPALSEIPSTQKVDFGAGWGINSSGQVSVTFEHSFLNWGRNFSWNLW